MGRRNRRGVMSEEFKYELAKDLGFYETVEREGWGGIRTKDAGNMVKRAIQIAEHTLVRQQAQQQGATTAQTGFQGPSVQAASYAPIPVPRSVVPQGGASQQGYVPNPGMNVPPAYMIPQVQAPAGSYMYGQRQ